MSTQARVTAHAKLNLFLHVLDRRPDGYHDIATWLVRLALGDDIVVRVRPSGRSVDCRGADVGPPERNLALRAANAYADAARWPDGFAIDIDKQIPVGGGLGGGSADAAAVLRALDALAPQPLGEDRLRAIAVGLGSDVPYLVSTDPAAFATGRGEYLLKMPSLGEAHVGLVCPPFGVATAEAYAWLDADRAAAGWQPKAVRYDNLWAWTSFPRDASNDLEPPVSRRHPEIARYIRALSDAGAHSAGMSGSGSTVFGVFDAAPDAAALERAVRAPVLLTHTLERIDAVQLID